MTTVIADDITGAAEIAGAALSHGLNTVLTVGCADCPVCADVWVIATDMRSGSEDDAVNTVRQIASCLKNTGGPIFKKTDSVLRGHVTAEINALTEALGISATMLLPQNPSRGRTIKDGIYYINGVPIDRTPFRDDPEFPVRSASVCDILGGNVEMLTVDGMPNSGTGRHIYAAEATNSDEINLQLSKAGENYLLAGGVDFFNAFLKKEYPYTKNKHEKHGKITPKEYSIILCGSTQSESIAGTLFARRSGTYETTVPHDVFNGAPADSWLASLPALYLRHKSLAINVGRRENAGPAIAARLRHVMAEAARQTAAAHTPDLLIIEGGATAYATISRLELSSFILTHEYAPGIVGMTNGTTEIILKPGSYPWGELL